MKSPSEDNACQSAELLNVEEIAKRLHECSTRTIYRHAQTGVLPRPLKIGGRSYWLESDVAELIAKQEKKRRR